VGNYNPIWYASRRLNTKAWDHNQDAPGSSDHELDQTARTAHMVVRSFGTQCPINPAQDRGLIAPELQAEVPIAVIIRAVFIVRLVSIGHRIVGWVSHGCSFSRWG
jgi:hypothetical protein